MAHVETRKLTQEEAIEFKEKLIAEALAANPRLERGNIEALYSEYGKVKPMRRKFSDEPNLIAVSVLFHFEVRDELDEEGEVVNDDYEQILGQLDYKVTVPKDMKHFVKDVDGAGQIMEAWYY